MHMLAPAGVHMSMGIQQTGYFKNSEDLLQAFFRHPYLILLLLFYFIAGTAAGISLAKTAEAQLVGAVPELFLSAAQAESYQLLPALLHSAALNLLLYCAAYLPRLWRPLFVAGGLSIGLKGAFMGTALYFLFHSLGAKGLAWGVPLCLAPGLLCGAAITLRLLGEVGVDNRGLGPRSVACLIFCIILESAAAPAILRFWPR